MATLTAGAPGVRMDLPTFFEQIETYALSPTEISTTYPSGETGLYEGTFTYSGSTLLSGTATGYEQFTSTGVPEWSVTNASLPYNVFAADYLAGNLTALEHYVLAGHDTYQGTTGTDVFVGQGGNDTFIGGSGTDVFLPASGNNTIEGGSGTEAVALSGSESQYTITANPDGSMTVTDSVPNRNGSNHITNVLELVFHVGNATLFTASPDDANLARLYSAALDRAPDPAGLKYWENVYNNDVSAAAKTTGTTVSLAQTGIPGYTSVADGFIASNEFIAAYGSSVSDSAFITLLYANVLSRAPDPGGFAYWQSEITSGWTHAMVLVGFAESNENVANSAKWLFTT